MGVRVYKILGAEEWAAARAAGVFLGAAVDHADGFIHLSGADQVAGTLALHFAGRDDLVLAGFDAAALGDALRWEASRGGALFPHLYGPLDLAHLSSATPLPRDAAGAHILPAPL